MPRVRLREMLGGDLEGVTAIERATFPDPWSRRSFAAMLRQSHIHAIVAEEPGGRAGQAPPLRSGDPPLLGYAMCSLVADEGEILNIAVTDDQRGKGLGRRLLDALLDYLKKGGATTVFLEVRRSNEAAIALYRACGFKPLGVRPSYYSEPREDALTMSLELGSQTAGK
jgi:ribosomal-protein-alanine N-acetyltransferase